MFGAGNLHNSADESERRTLPPIKSASDKYFLESLGEYIQHEKERLMCPDKGPDEQRYIIYSSAFDKVSTWITIPFRLVSASSLNHFLGLHTWTDQNA